MKKTFAAITLICSLLSVGLALYNNGYGRVVTASTAVTKISFPAGESANQVSIWNRGTVNRVFCLVDISVATCSNRITAGTAIPIDPGASFTFVANGQDSIPDICYGTTNGTTEVSIASF